MAKRTPLVPPGWAKKSDPRPDPLERTTSPAPPAVDGRSLRATGRTEQFATRISPETKAQIQQIARAEGITMAEVIERAVSRYLASI